VKKMSQRISFVRKELEQIRKSIYFDRIGNPYKYDAKSKIDNALNTGKTSVRIRFTLKELEQTYKSILYDRYTDQYKINALNKIQNAIKKETAVIKSKKTIENEKKKLAEQNAFE
jgi:hypothetical protein